MSKPTTFTELKKDFDLKTKALRETCTHPKVSKWIEEQWALMHPTGFEVKVCQVCDSIVNRRTTCRKCKKLVERKDFVEGDGKTRAFGEIFCSKCEEKWKNFIKKHPYKPKKIKVLHYKSNGTTIEKLETQSYTEYCCFELYDKFMKA